MSGFSDLGVTVTQIMCLSPCAIVPIVGYPDLPELIDLWAGSLLALKREPAQAFLSCLTFLGFSLLLFKSDIKGKNCNSEALG